MAARIPQAASQRSVLKICVICEGYEEYEYMQRLAEIGAWNPIYAIDLVNAKGNGNIPARYQDRYQNGDYDAVFAFCDTDQKPFEPYDEIKRKINVFHGVDGAADEVVVFGNPCTMQIIILHWRNIILESHKKNFNAPILEEVLHIRGYRARADQRERLFRNVTNRNFWKMYERVRGLPGKDTILGSSNFGKFIDRMRDSSGEWTRAFNEFLI
ncbi:MAG: hypothetical protein LUE29_07790 [Lachnospiraceae bacterium]|nr:hypothetical protein [Lachnospiraceae bacterium]